MRKLVLPLLVACGLSANAQSLNALSFNGLSTIVPINTPLSANSSYTKEAWVYATTGLGARNIMSSQNCPFWIADGVLKAGQAGTFDLVSDVIGFPLFVWTHVAVTYDAPTSIMKLYRNGLLVATKTSVAAYTPEASYIGSHNGALSFFLGNLDEIRLWSVARTQAEIQQTMLKGPAANATGLISYYNCNSTSGNILYNSCTNPGATNGTISNGSWTSSPVQHALNSLQLDGFNDYVDLGNSSALHPTGNMTVEILASSDNWSISGEQEIVSTFEAGGYGIYLQNGSLRFSVRASTGTSYTGPSYPASNLVNGNWYHISGSFDGRLIKLYVDGALVGTEDLLSSGNTITYTYPNNNMMIGADAGVGTLPAAAHFPGKVDEFRLWNVVRTPVEIAAMTKREINVNLNTGLVAYHNFNQGIPAGANTNFTTLIDQKGSYNATLMNFALGIGSSSNFIAQPSFIWALPLTWQSFTAQQQSGNVLLQWSTVNELNTQDFTVQHSTDGITWKAIGTVAAAGTTDKGSYRYVHTSPVAGVNHYRILQRDIDGKQGFSQIRTVQTGTEVAPFVVKNNPVISGTLQLQVNESIKLQILGNNGNLVLNKQAEPGSLQLDVSHFAKGVYWLKAGAYTKKILVQ